MRTLRKPWDIWALMWILPAICLYTVGRSVWYSTPLGGIGWAAAGIQTTLFQFGNPALAAVGATMLCRTPFRMSAKKLWLQLLPAVLAVVAVLWAMSAIVYMNVNTTGELDRFAFNAALPEVLESPANVRMLILSVFIVLMYPLLWRIYHAPSTALYGAIIFFCMCLVEPLLQSIPYLRLLALFLNQVNWNLFTAWGFYILVGFAVDQKAESFNWLACLLIYAAGLIAPAVNYAMIAQQTSLPLGFQDDYLSYDSIFSGIQVFAFLVFARRTSSRLPRSRKMRAFFARISSTWSLWIPCLFFNLSFLEDNLPMSAIPELWQGMVEGLILWLTLLCVLWCIAALLRLFPQASSIRRQ